MVLIPKFLLGTTPQTKSVSLPVQRWVRAAGREFRGTRSWLWSKVLVEMFWTGEAAGSTPPKGVQRPPQHQRKILKKKNPVFVAALFPSHVVLHRKYGQKNSEFSPPNAPEGPAPVSREDWVELQKWGEWVLIYNNFASEKEFENQPFWQDWNEFGG